MCYWLDIHGRSFGLNNNKNVKRRKVRERERKGENKSERVEL